MNSGEKHRLGDVSGSLARRTTREERELVNGHRAGILWLTGLSGAGKTTLALGLERSLFENGYQVVMIDGDDFRRTISTDLGFSNSDRSENIRRAGAVASVLVNAGVLVIAAFISPYRSDRERLRELHSSDFHEIWLSADIAVCEKRDVKGMYARARRGEIATFTGVSDKYEPPTAPNLVIDTGSVDVSASLQELRHYVEVHFGLSRKPIFDRGHK